MSRSNRPPGRGGGRSESTEDWRTSQLVGSRLPARCNAPGARDIVLSLLNDWSDNGPQTTRTKLHAKRKYTSNAISAI
jgi:hypothetical protein